ncbi:carboxynorspermidine decarboxylase [Bacillus atrophaeus]|uniref:carboxynorspermidine decarboxylase n=1 Tax=Bacillus atrophaeus TaxID=1452 RepID=UPI002DBF5CBD|nr:carboxynorspermidine decarboxylase [Bacillus atrophaeus]MEC1903239.1 carboxynorspermidine decarboxylase [Bacillus atrophaeus]MEC2399356.1 carboxynorspermidine decarboxylase [Bacillus atrophaeus]MED4437542.1 carboxynorspermidine decarboxylase [Bacillus atrophaeus]MED4567787.1 carboxynorspermidine decarboxylase [Bacillus atrophaeus]MED4778995.1 carboxynorspermidine decarboxylase [Bacillus atrophaeus]
MSIKFESIPTPSYVFDEDAFRNNLEIIDEIKKRTGGEIIISLKGFAMWGVFHILREYGFEAAASSLNEAKLIEEQLSSSAYTYIPAYSAGEFDKVLSLSSHITFNSIAQLNKFLPRIKENAPHVQVALRINPESSPLQYDIYNPCIQGSRFGVTMGNLNGITVGEIDGLHFHSLCESSSYDLENILELIKNRFAGVIKKIKWINLGGGHLMTSSEYNIDHLVEVIAKFRAETGLDIIMEPCTAFVWNTGYLVTRILDIVSSNNINTAILDISFSAHLLDFHLMNLKPSVIGATEPQEGKPTYRLGGNSCLSGDYIGEWSFDNDLKVGDVVIIKNIAHYTMVKENMFNGVTQPSIGVWNSQEGYRLVRKFGYNDYKNRLS